jgi:Ca-activated chloride channel family protein
MKLTSLVLSTAIFAVSVLPGFSKGAPVNPSPLHVSLLVDRTVLPADATEHSVIKIALDGVKPARRDARPPVNLAIVIDRSGSMSGPKLERAREAALEAVNRLAPDDVACLVAFDTSVEVLRCAQPVGDGDGLRRAIRRIEAGGNTALYDGVNRAASELRQRSEDRHYLNRILLLSDGEANVGPSTPAELGRLGTALLDERISVTTIGLGLGFNEDLMTRLAERSDGNTYFVQESSDLPAIFAAEIGDVLSVVAQRVTIEIEFPAGVRPLRFIGRQGVIRNGKAELTLNQVYGGQQKFALLEVEVVPSPAGTSRDVAAARVQYLDAVNQRTCTIAVQAGVKFTADRTVVIASANHQVQADYAANVIAQTKDEAVALADAHQNVAAGALMKQRVQELTVLGSTYQNSLISGFTAPAAADADRLAREGLDNARRKAYRADSAQTRNQQNTTSAGDSH